MATESKANMIYPAGGNQSLKKVLEQVSSTEHRLSIIVRNLRHQLQPKDSDLSVTIPVLFERLRGEILKVQKENAYLTGKLYDTENQVSELEDEVSGLKKALEHEEEARNEREQEEMRDTLRFLGVTPDEEEDSRAECVDTVLSIIRDKLQLRSIRCTDINAAHRVGSRGEDPRPILVRFYSSKHKNRVLTRRRLLKGTGILIVEDLTPLNMSRLAKVKTHPNVKTCWTKAGKILALRKDDKTVLIQNGDLSILSDQACHRPPPDLDRSACSSSSSDSSSDSETSSDTRPPKSVVYTRSTESKSNPDRSPVFHRSNYKLHTYPAHSFRWAPYRGSFRPPWRGRPFFPFKRGRPYFRFRYRGYSQRRPYRWFQPMDRRYHAEESQRPPRSRDDSRTKDASRPSHHKDRSLNE